MTHPLAVSDMVEVPGFQPICIISEIEKYRARLHPYIGENIGWFTTEQVTKWRDVYWAKLNGMGITPQKVAAMMFPENWREPLPSPAMRSDWPAAPSSHPSPRLFFVEVDGTQLAIMDADSQVALGECAFQVRGHYDNYARVDRKPSFAFRPESMVRIVG